MMRLRILILGTAALILGYSAAPKPKATKRAPEPNAIEIGGVSFAYSTKDVAAVTIEKVKKNLSGGSE